MTSKNELQRLSDRLERLGMRFEGERLWRAAAIVRAHGADPDRISDMALLTICVEAYRRPEAEPLPIV